jgi:A/G-specific adenine glycosylase
MPLSTDAAQAFRTRLLAWYARAHRPMPWRDLGATPYHIWLAEIMLQQTTVAAVIPYYRRFLMAFPTVESLAAAQIDQILHLWQGLGYYRRAHLLHKCAQTIVEKHHGQFPQTEAELLALPGLGAYTAAVLMATAFNQPATVVDGNVERVITRLFRVQQPLPSAKPAIRELAAQLACHAQPKLYANAIMELGSQICTPKNPNCLLCPVNEFCRAFKAGDQATYPRKSPKSALPEHTATAYLLTDSKGRLYLQQRPATGMLASLWELPHTGWERKPTHPAPAIPTHTNAQPVGAITHTFTHYKLTLNLIAAATPKIPASHAFTAQNLPPLSTLMRKALARTTL